MLPAWTQADPAPAAPIVTVAEARNWVGLFGDSSLDAELGACLEAAIEKVADFIGYRIQDTGITDYFTGGRELELSEPGIDTATVKVVYSDAGGSDAVLDSSRWSLDPTAERNTVVIDSLPELSGALRHPLRITYTSKLAHVRGPATVGRIKTAVRMETSRLWRSRGEPQDPALTDRALTSLRASCRLDPPVAA